jgi:hypothetical protein
MFLAFHPSNHVYLQEDMLRAIAHNFRTMKLQTSLPDLPPISVVVLNHTTKQVPQILRDLLEFNGITDKQLCFLIRDSGDEQYRCTYPDARFITETESHTIGFRFSRAKVVVIADAVPHPRCTTFTCRGYASLALLDACKAAFPDARIICVLQCGLQHRFRLIIEASALQVYPARRTFLVHLPNVH